MFVQKLNKYLIVLIYSPTGAEMTLAMIQQLTIRANFILQYNQCFRFGSRGENDSLLIIHSLINPKKERKERKKRMKEPFQIVPFDNFYILYCVYITKVATSVSLDTIG